MFGWIKSMFARNDKAEMPHKIEVHPVDIRIERSAADIERIKAHNRELIKQVAQRLKAHNFSNNPL